MTDSDLDHPLTLAPPAASIALEPFKAPITVGNQLKQGDRITAVVLGPGDDRSQELRQFYNVGLLVIAYDPAPPLLEPRCEVEIEPEIAGEPPTVGTVIAVSGDFAWVESRLGGHAVYPRPALKVIRGPGK